MRSASAGRAAGDDGRGDRDGLGDREAQRGRQPEPGKHGVLLRVRRWAASTARLVPAAKNGDAGSGGDPVTVTRFISGLVPDTTYHYRLVAVNGLGTSVASDRTFGRRRRRRLLPADSCANADVRAQQQSFYLPDCRAYEMVSPVDKNGGDVLGFDTDVRSSEAGDRATYASFSGFAGAPNIRYTAQYLGGRAARRMVYHRAPASAELRPFVSQWAHPGCRPERRPEPHHRQRP